MAPLSRSWGMWDIQFDGFSQLKSDLTRFETKITHAAPIMEKSFVNYGALVSEGFDTEGSVTSTTWASLSDWRYQERGSGNPILDYESGLRRAASEFTSTSTSERRGTVGAMKQVHDSGGWIGVSGPKVFLQDEWTNAISGRKVPARPFWPWNDDAIDVIVEPFEDFIDGWLSKSA